MVNNFEKIISDSFGKLSFCIATKNIITETAYLIFKVDDGGDDEEASLRNGGDRGKPEYMLIVLSQLY